MFLLQENFAAATIPADSRALGNRGSSHNDQAGQMLLCVPPDRLAVNPVQRILKDLARAELKELPREALRKGIGFLKN
ncbi:hypothetical protein [Methylocystis echinoides]|uniref:hypothetical protein n=1 Tax=Methylocystis echinoides TaxID=29468 RepID=UPI00343DD15E